MAATFNKGLCKVLMKGLLVVGFVTIIFVYTVAAVAEKIGGETTDKSQSMLELKKTVSQLKQNAKRPVRLIITLAITGKNTSDIGQNTQDLIIHEAQERAIKAMNTLGINNVELLPGLPMLVAEISPNQLDLLLQIDSIVKIEEDKLSKPQ